MDQGRRLEGEGGGGFKESRHHKTWELTLILIYVRYFIVNAKKLPTEFHSSEISKMWPADSYTGIFF